jgi:hypothetical protein
MTENEAVEVVTKFILNMEASEKGAHSTTPEFREARNILGHSHTYLISQVVSIVLKEKL